MRISLIIVGPHQPDIKQEKNAMEFGKLTDYIKDLYQDYEMIA